MSDKKDAGTDTGQGPMPPDADTGRTPRVDLGKAAKTDAEATPPKRTGAPAPDEAPPAGAPASAPAEASSGATAPEIAPDPAVSGPAVPDLAAPDLAAPDAVTPDPVAPDHVAIDPAPAADPAPQAAAPRDWPAREPEPDPQPDPADEYHEEPERRSLAARALQALVILLVGATLALWAAPKLAPSLPEGVAQYLLPADLATRDELAALRDEVAAVSAAAEAAPEAVAPVDPASAIEDAVAPLRETLSTLAAQLDETQAAAVESRLAQAETTLSGVTAQLEAIDEGLSSLDASAGEIPPLAAERLATFAGQLTGVRAEVSSLSERTAALARRIDEAEARFAQEAEAAEARADAEREAAAARARAAEIDRGFALLTQGLDEGALLTAPLDALSQFGEAPAALHAARNGVATMAQLRASLTPAARAALSAHRVETAGEGVVDRFVAAVGARLEGVPLADTGGSDAYAALGRAAERMTADDLSGALEALEALPPEAAAAMADWVAAAIERRDAVEAAADWRARLDAGAS